MPENYKTSSMLRSSHHSAFTLIELLVVIAIIAILSVVVILVLNPAELLRQSRDSNRISDLATMTEALGVFQADQSNGSLGSSSVIYVSIPDPAATSSLGDQCQGLGLISLPATYSYHCAATSTYRSVDSTGWVPVNFTSASFGSPIGSLPVDPVNQSSTRLYYTYTTNGSQFEFTAPMESQKYQLGGSNDVISNDGGSLATVYEKGTKYGLEPLDYGDTTLVGYWALNEGVGSTSYDYSGNNATGSWAGTATGTSGYYSPGKGKGYTWAGSFDGSTDYVNTSFSYSLTPASNFTWTAWVNLTTLVANTTLIGNRSGSSGGWAEIGGSGFFQYGTGNIFSPTISTSTWELITVTKSASAFAYYLNGALVNTASNNTTISNMPFYIGEDKNAVGSGATGLIDDVRVYNRALTAAQIAAMYAGGK